MRLVRILSKKILLKAAQAAFFVVTILSLLLTSFPVTQVQAADAAKKVLGSGPFNENDEVTLQIDATKFPLINQPLIEMVIVVDTSRSMETAIRDLRNTLKAFAGNGGVLEDYPGIVRIGITKIGNGQANFDTNSSNDVLANGDGNENPISIFTGVDKVRDITTPQDYADLSNALDDMAIEDYANPKQLPVGSDGVNSYTSDISNGIARGNHMFTGDTNKKYMVLLTDGLANEGACPINSNGTPNISLPSGVDFQVIATDNEETDTPVTKLNYTEDTIFPLDFPHPNGEPGVCKPFIVNGTYPEDTRGLYSDNIDPHYYIGDVGNPERPLPHNSMLAELAKAYGGIRTTDIDSSAFQDIIDEVKITDITLSDTLSSSVFSQATSFVGTYRCSSGFGSKIQSDGYVPSGRDVTVTIKPANVVQEDKFCIRFKALIKPGVIPGTRAINSSSGNIITYKNTNGKTLGSQDIADGSITIASPVVVAGTNLQPDEFALTDIDGNDKQAFTTNENIYVQNDVKNVLADDSASGAITRYYADEPAALPGGAANPYQLCLNHGSFTGNRTYEYGSFNGHPKQANFTSCNGKTSWKQAAVGEYVARVYVNYLRSAGPVAETIYTDNQATQKYTVYTPPTNLSVIPLSCHSAKFSWTNGTQVASYKLRVKNVKKVTPVDRIVTSPYTWPDLADGPNTYEWGIIPMVHINGGGDVEGAEIMGNQFSTTACLGFSFTDPGILNPVPGGPATSKQVTINYDPTAADWGSNTINLAIRAVQNGTTSCNGITTSSPIITNPVNGLTALVNGATSKTITAPSNPSISVQADSSVSPGSTFTICLTGDSSASSDTPVIAIHVTIPTVAWLQVGSSAGSPATGDVHSNGDFSMSFPTSPIKYLFTTASGLAGASGAFSLPSSFAQTTSWKVNGYTKITTDPYDEAFKSVQSRGSVTTVQGTGPILTSASPCRGVTTGTQLFKFTDTGTVELDNADISFNCNANVVLFVDGDLHVSNNVTDTSTTGTLTIISKGDITIDSSVTRMDGVYLFGGTLSDSGGANQLTVNGSLLGLAGQNPGASTGKLNLSRSLAGASNTTTPAEVINYQPKYLILLKDISLGGSTYSWTE